MTSALEELIEAAQRLRRAWLTGDDPDHVLVECVARTVERYEEETQVSEPKSEEPQPYVVKAMNVTTAHELLCWGEWLQVTQAMSYSDGLQFLFDGGRCSPGNQLDDLVCVRDKPPAPSPKTLRTLLAEEANEDSVKICLDLLATWWDENSEDVLKRSMQAVQDLQDPSIVPGTWLTPPAEAVAAVIRKTQLGEQA